MAVPPVAWNASVVDLYACPHATELPGAPADASPLSAALVRSQRMKVLIDLHCHLLPGLDDGALDLNDAIAMARQGHADGIAAICATPHIRDDHDVRIAELPARRAELEAALRAARCEVHVLPGAEVAVSALEGLHEEELTAMTLGGGGRWILLEPDPGPLDERIELAIERLQARGFRALIAHPERHAGEDLLVRLGRLVANGALVQVTADYLVDESTRPAMLALARAGALHVLGSDAHSSRAGRPVALAAALAVLRDVPLLAHQLTWIARAAPELIVRGEEVTPPFWI